MASIEIKGITKEFQLEDGSLLALDDISLTVGDNEFVTLLGPSGCGKSTLLRLVADILQPTSGEILLHGVSPQIARERLLYSFVFQNPVMMPWRSVIENVSLPLEIVGRDNIKDVTNSPEELLDLVGLKGFENANPDQLSGGMKQRAAIARSLLLNPKVLLMDEPFGALDEISRDRMNLELLRIWQETDAAVFFVTHSIEEAVFLSDRVIVLSSRPGTIRANVVIDIPRPRVLEIKQSEQCFRFGAVLRQALAEGVSSSEPDDVNEDVMS